MSDEKLNDGGQAVSELSLRDYFAGQALVACWGNEQNRQRAAEDARASGRHLYAQMALEAYDVADAMLAARETRQ